jgi:2,6-dihydroxypseudooxynicotine hydrolase
MQRDPQVDLIFSHFIPRYEATGVDPNDLRALMPRVTQWQDWCRLWSEEGARHEALGEEAKAKGYRRTAAESFVRAAMYYHYGKHLFADRAEAFQRAHEAMLRCYSAGAAHLDPPIERVEFQYRGVAMPGWLRKPRGVARPPVAIILPGLDACKEELHAWAEGFVDRGLAALTLDGPGQGETSFHLPVTHEWGGVIGAVIDVLERRDDVDGSRVGVVGQSLGALYAPLAAAGEPRLKACIANCGPFDWGTVLPKMPKVSQEVFRVRSHSKTIEECHERGKALTLEGRAENSRCPLLVIFGAGDRLIAPAEGERLFFGFGDLCNLRLFNNSQFTAPGHRGPFANLVKQYEKVVDFRGMTERVVQKGQTPFETQDLEMSETSFVVNCQRDDLRKRPRRNDAVRRAGGLDTGRLDIRRADDQQPVFGQDEETVGKVELGIEVYPENRRNPFIRWKLPRDRATVRLGKVVEVGLLERQLRQLLNGRLSGAGSGFSCTF